MSKSKEIRVNALSRFMIYILGHRPDEFGLVPDRDGFLTLKELLWALHEEPGWSHVRQAHINEVLVGREKPLFQTEGNKIRTVERQWRLNLDEPFNILPKILYLAIRRKAHPHVMEKGLALWGDDRYLILSPDPDMAQRMGRRRDHKPVLLEIMASSAQGAGMLFFPFGELFLTREILPRFIAGPPVSKEVIKTRAEEKDEGEKARPYLGGGTFILDIKRDPESLRRAKGKKQKGWKEEAKKIRKRKREG